MVLWLRLKNALFPTNSCFNPPSSMSQILIVWSQLAEASSVLLSQERPLTASLWPPRVCKGVLVTPPPLLFLAWLPSSPVSASLCPTNFPLHNLIVLSQLPEANMALSLQAAMVSIDLSWPLQQFTISTLLLSLFHLNMLIVWSWPPLTNVSSPSHDTVLTGWVWP